MDPELLGSRIRAARERLGLSQEDLAVAVAKDQHAISQYENGKRKLAVTDLPAFADALQVPLTYFFEGETTLQALDLLVLDAFRKLPTPESKQAAITLIRVLFETLEPYHRP